MTAVIKQAIDTAKETIFGSKFNERPLPPGMSLVLTGSLQNPPVLLGEGPCWDSNLQALYWVDTKSKVVHLYNPKTAANQTFHVPGSKQVSAVIPRAGKGKDNEVIVGLEDGIYFWNLNSGESKFLDNPETSKPGNRFNDCKCDPMGRLFAGTMEDAETGQVTGGLYVLNPQSLKAHIVIPESGMSNGMAWSNDRTKFYWNDTPKQMVYEFDYDQASGAITNRRELIKIEEGKPDGLNIDSQGNLWVCHYGAGLVTRWNPLTRQQLLRLELPVSEVSSCCWGGEDLKDLYITTASKGTSFEKEPLAGSLFLYRSPEGITGVETFYFSG